MKGKFLRRMTAVFLAGLLFLDNGAIGAAAEFQEAEELPIEELPIEELPAEQLSLGNLQETIAPPSEDANPQDPFMAQAPLDPTEPSVPEAKALENITLNASELTKYKGETATLTVSYDPADATEKPEISWKSSDETIVTVTPVDGDSTQASINAVSEGSAEITATAVSAAGEKTAVCKVTVSELLINAVRINKTALENTTANGAGAIRLSLADEGSKTATVTAEAFLEDGTKFEDPALSWTSSNESVVTVAATSGTVTLTAKGVGNAVITAAAENGISDSVNVVVAPAAANISVANGTELMLYCNADKLAAGIDKTNLKAAHKITMNAALSYTYRSSDAKVAAVSADGTITAKAPGEADITVLHQESANKAVVHVTVKRLVEQISLPQIKNDTIKVSKNSKTTIPLLLLPAAADGACLETIAAASADEQKVVASLAPGQGAARNLILEAKDITVSDVKVTITAKTAYGAENPKPDSAKCEIMVKVEEAASSVKTFTVPSSLKLVSGGTRELSGTAKDANGDPLIWKDLFIGYASSNEAAASVDKDGKITANKGGSAVITAYTLDGSNKKASCTVTVEQRPASIAFDRTVYGVTKSAAGMASLTLKPIFAPAATAASQKGVTWEVVSVKDKTDNAATPIGNYFAVSTTGVVSVKKAAAEGMKAVIRCTSKAYGGGETAVYGETAILVQPKKISSLKFSASAYAVTGLNVAHPLSFVPTLAAGMALSKEDYKLSVSDETIATAAMGEGNQALLTAKKYGTVTVTLCADNAVSASCKVTVYPVAKGTGIAAREAKYFLQTAENDANDKAALQFVDAATKKEVIDRKLFTYYSSNSALVSVDENGIAYANPKADIVRNATVTITAVLTDDPDKRKATTQVVLCAKNQIARLDVKYYATKAEAKKDETNVSGRFLASGKTMTSEGEENFVLRIMPYDAKGNHIANPDIKVASSDEELAYISGAERKKETPSANYYIWEIVATIRQPGQFSIIVSALDDQKVSRKLDFGVYDGKPIIATAGLGTIDKNSSRKTVTVTDRSGDRTGDRTEKAVLAQSDFILLAANGTDIEKVMVKQAKITIKDSAGKEQSRIYSKYFFDIEEKPNNAYRLMIDEKILEDAVPGVYDVILSVTRSGLEEESGIGILQDGAGSYTHMLETTFTVTDTKPAFSSASVTLNAFIKGEEAKIPLKTTWKPELTVQNIAVRPDLALKNQVVITKKEDGWYVKLNDQTFNDWKSQCTYSGTLDITLEGYDKPVPMRLSITAKSTKPVIKQKEVPVLHLAHGSVADIVLADAKKAEYGDYTAEVKNSLTAAIKSIEAQPAAVRVTLQEGIAPGPGGKTYTQKISVKKEEWREAVEASLSVKAYSGTSVPAVTFAKTTLYINRYAGVAETFAKTQVRVSHSNAALKNGTWTIPASYKNSYCTYNNVFEAEYKDGELTISLKDPEGMNLRDGTYTFTMTGLEMQAENVTVPQATARLSVIVRRTKPTVTVRMAGTLDLINRSVSTLKGTVTVASVNSAIKSIALGDALKENYRLAYTDGNTFTLYAISGKELKTARTSGEIVVTMTDDTVHRPTITFTPAQSVPKIGTPKAQTIYKSAAAQTVLYDFNADITKGVKVREIAYDTVPEGFRLQKAGGRLYVILQNKTLKAGTYTVKANLHVKDAQAGTKAVQKTVSVVVKE